MHQPLSVSHPGLWQLYGGNKRLFLVLLALTVLDLKQIFTVITALFFLECGFCRIGCTVHNHPVALLLFRQIYRQQ